MASSLLGYWPGECPQAGVARSSSSGSREEQILIGCLKSQYSNIDRSISRPASGDARYSQRDDELYFDAPSSPQLNPATEPGGPSRSLQNGFPPSLTVVTNISNIDNIEWQSFQPPAELLYVPSATPMEIESILEASIAKLQNRLVEQDRLRDEEATQARDKGKGKEPVILIEGDGSNETQSTHSVTSYVSSMGLSRRSKVRISDASNLTASSADSGYASGVSDVGSLKSFLGRSMSIGGLFRRSKDKTESPKPDSQSPRSMATRECVSCLDEFESRELVPLACHSYCKTCFQTLIGNAIGSETHWPPKCCLNEVPTETVLLYLNPKTHKRYKEVLQERLIPAGERIYCSKPTCGVWIPPSNIKKATLCAVCPSCRTKSCISCRGAHHGNGDCPQDPSMKATLQLASDEGWRRCYSCKVMVEHNQGCIHMTCKCKAQFCYICGLKWRTCSCADTQLGNIRAAADARRRQAEAQEEATRAAARVAEAQAEELREMLQMIEDYEMEEAARLAREDEENRQAAQEARLRKEEARVMTVSKKYFELGKELEFLHALQKVAISERYENDQRELRREINYQEATIADHAAEVQHADAVGKTRIHESEIRFEQDYQARMVKERQIEDDYTQRLTEYWTDRPGGDVKITEGKEALRNAHTVAYRQWEAARRTKHQQVVNAAKEDTDRLRRQHETELAVIGSRMHATEQDLERARNSAYKWLEAVASMRVKMLQSMEEQEYTRDE